MSIFVFLLSGVAIFVGAFCLNALFGKTSLLTTIKETLWGHFAPGELQKFLVLATIGVSIIGSSWALRTIKEALFQELVGLEYLSIAKICSVLSLVILIALYNYLVNRVSLEAIFAFFSSLYAIIFSSIGILYFLIDPVTKTIPALGSLSSKWLGWLIVIAIESFSSIAYTHFYAYVANTTTTESAKRGYGMIVFASQVGCYLGPTLSMNIAHNYSFSAVFYTVALGIMAIPLLVKLYQTVIPASLRSSDNAAFEVEHEKEQRSMFTGLKLLTQHPYLMGLAFISTVYDAVGMIFELQFKILIGNYHTGIAYAKYVGTYAQTNAIVGMFFAIFGTSFFLRSLGVRTCLLLYPSLLALIITGIYFNPVLSTFFIGMIFIKTMGYTLNRPVQEIMFIPTGKAVKTQVKSIVDSIGKRFAKASGAAVIRYASVFAESIVPYTCAASLGIIGVWVFVAAFTGKKYEELMKDKTIIG